MESGNSPGAPKRRLLDQLGDAIRRLHYSRRTEESYRHWIRRYIFFHGKRHPAEIGEAEVTAFLSHLATDRHVAASTQNQALSALRFLYKEVLGRELAWLDGLLVRDGKGQKDRVTMRPSSLVPAMQAQIERARVIHEYDLAKGFGVTHLPYALARKYPSMNGDG